jgi:phytoene/squalene synthetase
LLRAPRAVLQNGFEARWMDIDQHENFPIASVLLPKALRTPVGIIYQVVRTAADIADEGDGSAAERRARTLTMQRSRRVGVAARSIEGNA